MGKLSSGVWALSPNPQSSNPHNVDDLRKEEQRMKELEQMQSLFKCTRIPISKKTPFLNQVTRLTHGPFPCHSWPHLLTYPQS